jgi:hypothetical protein
MVKKILLVFSGALFLISPVALAQSTDFSTKATDLMGQRPGNSYYQDSGGVLSTGTGTSVGSANSSYLQGEATGPIKVDSPAPVNQAVLVQTKTTKKSYTWLIFAGLAAFFLVIDILYFVFRVKNRPLQAPTLKDVYAEPIQNLPNQEEAVSPVSKKETTKTKPKKKTNRHHPVKRRKKR